MCVTKELYHRLVSHWWGSVDINQLARSRNLMYVCIGIQLLSILQKVSIVVFAVVADRLYMADTPSLFIFVLEFAVGIVDLTLRIVSFISTQHALKHEMQGYSTTSNMRCKIHVLGCFFLRGSVWKSPARYFHRPY